MKRKKQKNMRTYTQKAVKALLVVGVIGGLTPYILSALGRDPVADIGKAWITEIVAVILVYMLKAYFETKQEKKQRLADFKAGLDDGEGETMG